MPPQALICQFVSQGACQAAPLSAKIAGFDPARLATPAAGAAATAANIDTSFLS
jgi:hypothetical protein